MSLANCVPRILYLEKKFFCDKATEKTVYLMVKDQFDTLSHKQVHTRKVSCQFPILEIEDLSSTNGDNKFANGWEVSASSSVFSPYLALAGNISKQ